MAAGFRWLNFVFRVQIARYCLARFGSLRRNTAHQTAQPQCKKHLHCQQGREELLGDVSGDLHGGD